MKYIQNKKNALLILLLSLFSVIGILFVNTIINNYFYDSVFDKFIPLFLFTGGTYFVCATLFLFFVDNLTVKNWFFRSIWFTVAAAPFLLMFGFADGAFLSQLILFPAFFSYFLLFLYTPNYVFHNLEYDKEELSLKDKKYALVILVINILVFISWFFIIRVTFNLKVESIINQLTSFVFYTSITYFVSSVVFLFFYKNSIVKKWIYYSLYFICATFLNYWSQPEFIKRNSLNLEDAFMIFVLYIVLLISTPFYLNHQSKKLKKIDSK